LAVLISNACSVLRGRPSTSYVTRAVQSAGSIARTTSRVCGDSIVLFVTLLVDQQRTYVRTVWPKKTSIKKIFYNIISISIIHVQHCHLFIRQGTLKHYGFRVGMTGYVASLFKHCSHKFSISPPTTPSRSHVECHFGSKPSNSSPTVVHLKGGRHSPQV
jgi:hypothetical protein